MFVIFNIGKISQNLYVSVCWTTLKYLISLATVINSLRLEKLFVVYKWITLIKYHASLNPKRNTEVAGT
jgi:hypothetical protein